MRDFGCGELHTIASTGCASVHYYIREPAHPHRKVEHAYPSHSLVFTDIGEWQYHASEKPSTITGDIVVTGIGQRHYSCAHPRNVSNECFIVAIEDAAFDGDAAVFASPTIPLSPEMRALRRAIINAVRAPADGEQIESLAFSLYEIAARISTRSTRVPPADVRMTYAKKVLRDRCSERFSIAEIAQALDLSRFTFTRRFLAAAGVTPHQFVMQLRIERAKEALTRTNRSIEDIGLANGFGSIAHFSHAFRAVVGATPTAYRLATSIAISR